MNVGKAITAAMRDQRRKDMAVLARNISHYYAVMAYWWWGWDIHGRGGLGKPGADL